GGIFDWDTAQLRLDALKAQTESPDIWNDLGKARIAMRERDELDVAVKTVRELEAGIADNVELIELGEAEGDAEIVRDAENALVELKAVARRTQIETLLSGEVAANDCYVEIHSG